MRKQLLLALLATSMAPTFGSGFTQKAETFFVSAATLTPRGSEAFLEIEYELACDSSVRPALQLPVTGIAKIANRRVRLDFVGGRDRLEVALGVNEHLAGVEIEVRPNSSCALQSKAPRIVFRNVLDRDAAEGKRHEALALQHSPFLVVRDDQYANRTTDVPLLLTYHVEKKGASTTLTYTAYFTDEDSKPSTEETNAQMTRYGRRSDIEWLYRVELDRSGQVRARSYHGFLHLERDFTGEFLPGTEHPILYNYANALLGKAGRNNVFSDTPTRKQSKRELEGHHLVPSQIAYPLAREWAYFQEPWIIQASDQELLRERKLSAYSTDYIYILIDGKLKGSFTVELNLADGRKFLAGHGEGQIKVLGEDMWNRQVLTAIPVGQELIEQIVTQRLTAVARIVPKSLGTELQLFQPLRYFRLVLKNGRYVTQELRALAPGALLP